VDLFSYDINKLLGEASLLVPATVFLCELFIMMEFITLPNLDVLLF